MLKLAVAVIFQIFALAQVGFATFLVWWIVPRQPSWLVRIGVIGFALSFLAGGLLASARAWVIHFKRPVLPRLLPSRDWQDLSRWLFRQCFTSLVLAMASLFLLWLAARMGKFV